MDTTVSFITGALSEALGKRVMVLFLSLFVLHSHLLYYYGLEYVQVMMLAYRFNAIALLDGIISLVACYYYYCYDKETGIGIFPICYLMPQA